MNEITSNYNPQGLSKPPTEAEKKAHAATKKEYAALYDLFVTELENKYGDNKQTRDDILATLRQTFRKHIWEEARGRAAERLSDAGQSLNGENDHGSGNPCGHRVARSSVCT
jgi:hypothetical protein